MTIAYLADGSSRWVDDDLTRGVWTIAVPIASAAESLQVGSPIALRQIAMRQITLRRRITRYPPDWQGPLRGVVSYLPTCSACGRVLSTSLECWCGHTGPFRSVRQESVLVEEGSP